MPAPPEPAPPVSPQDVTLLVQRMRSVLLRMDASARKPKPPGAGQLNAWRAARDEVKARESRTARVHAVVEERVTGLNQLFGARLYAGLEQHLSTSGFRVIPDLERTLHALIETQTPQIDENMTPRLDAIERNSSAAVRQLEEVRKTTLETYVKVDEFGTLLDAVWADQNSSGVGGWRQWMRRAWAEVSEKHSQDDDTRQAVDDEPSTPEIQCPRCGKLKARRRPRFTVLENAMKLVSLSPYRCRQCKHHFYKFTRH